MLQTLTQQQKVSLKVKFDEISNSLTRISAERDLIKDIINDIKEEFEIQPKIARRLSKIYHKRNLDEVVSEGETIVEVYEEVLS